jgi:hypothetical protein
MINYVPKVSTVTSSCNVYVAFFGRLKAAMVNLCVVLFISCICYFVEQKKDLVFCILIRFLNAVVDKKKKKAAERKEH